jgi:site-specific recombinase XerD
MKLSQVVQQYVDLKQAMGSRFHAESVILKAFCNAMEDVPLAEVGAERVMAYIAGTGHVTRFWHRKHEALRGFYRFAMGRGYAKSSPLPEKLPRPSRVFTPYIYSSDELHRLIEATERCVSSRTKLQSPTLRTMLLLLYGAGLRIGEALRLTPQDVDLDNRLLTIRESKFYRTRLVPVGSRLTSALVAYDKQRSQWGYPPGKVESFFVTRHGQPVTRSLAERTFCRLRDLANVYRHDGSRYQPRLHDLRHSFAVHRLVAWYRDGADVQRLLPQLSTYLGHVHISATQRYLTMTPDLLYQASVRFERYAQPMEIYHD